MKKLGRKVRSVVLILSVFILAIFTMGTKVKASEEKLSPRKYVEDAIHYMDYGLYAKGKEWQKAKTKAIIKSRNLKSYSETYPLIREALKVAGGKHSFLSTIEDYENRKNSGVKREPRKPEVKLDKDILIVKIVEFGGNEEKATKYAQDVLDKIKENEGKYKGVIVDLRDNVGGDMGPMVSAISPFIPDGKVISFKTRYGLVNVNLKNGTTFNGGTPVKVNTFKVKPIPIAVLQNGLTASSGEITLLSFRGLDKVKTFGEPTSGYCSCNAKYELKDGSHLMVTTGFNVTRDGEEMPEEPVKPDVETKTPIKDAKKWIYENVK